MIMFSEEIGSLFDSGQEDQQYLFSRRRILRKQLLCRRHELAGGFEEILAEQGIPSSSIKVYGPGPYGLFARVSDCKTALMMIMPGNVALRVHLSRRT